ncbi:MAG: hypothetical protein IT200_09105 [Thermoleophilia bacterium]|nr:hypothetical protein [Thermoleophilia bacterium]
MIRSPRSLTLRSARVACLLGAGAVALSAFPASAAGPVGAQQRVSFSGDDANRAINAYEPAVAENPRTGQHLMVWTRASAARAGVFGRLVDRAGTPLGTELQISDPGRVASDPTVAYNARRNEFMVAFAVALSADETEIHVHRVSAAGTPLGSDVRISTMGADGAGLADLPDIAWNPTRDEYLVAWAGRETTTGEEEVYVQRVTPDGAGTGPDDLRISSAGPDGDAAFSASDPAVAYDERHDAYMVAWSADDDTGGHVARDYEIHVQRLTGDGAETGTDDRRVSEAGTPGDNEFASTEPDIAYDPVGDRFLVAWLAHNDGPPTGSAREVFTQALTSDGAETGPDDQRVSETGPYVDITLTRDPAVAADVRAGELLVTWSGTNPTLPADKVEVFAQRMASAGTEIDGDTRVSVTPATDAAGTLAEHSALAFDSGAGQFVVAWEAAGTLAPPAPGKSEISTVRYQGGTPVALAATLCRAIPPLADPPEGDPSKITLSVNQLLINQRIDQAAIRRANGVQSWIDDGVESRDLCQAALGVEELVPGSVGGFTGLPTTHAQPDPRPVVIPPAVAGDPSKVTLTVNQLLINQRISQAAIRRLNALKARLDAGLTGGDVKDGQVGRSQLKAGTTVLFTPVTTPVTASVTSIAPPSPGDPGKVTLSINQLLINQRISQAAVKRANELIHRLGEGIGPEEVRNGGLTAADLAPGLALSTTP